MIGKTFVVVLLSTMLASGGAFADELTKSIQQDLTTLGYDPGNVDGELTTQTVVAISRFQADHKLEITGEPTPLLAGVIKSAINQPNSPAGASTAAATTVQDPEALRAAQQACLQEKIAAREAANKKKRGVGSLVRAVSRTASWIGGDTAYDIARTTHAVYDVNATAADLESAARDLGLTPDEVEQCRNPQ